MKIQSAPIFSSSSSNTVLGTGEVLFLLQDIDKLIRPFSFKKFVLRVLIIKTIRGGGGRARWMGVGHQTILQTKEMDLKNIAEGTTDPRVDFVSCSCRLQL